MALPFQQGSGRDWFPQIPLPFPPYRHQEKAFDRLLPGTPRNTLVATDQARRIADDSPSVAMSATHVITDKQAQHKAPPDILLTNYKQLDYLLVQPASVTSGATTDLACSVTWWWMSSTASMAPRALTWAFWSDACAIASTARCSMMLA